MVSSYFRSLALLTLVLALAAPVQAQVAYNSAQLTWSAPGDDGSIGTATQYDLRYSTATITEANFASATRWSSMPTPAIAGTQQTVTVTGLNPSTTYYFAIKTADDASNWSAISNVAMKTTGAAPDLTRPAPIAVSVSSITDTTATLGWTAVGDDSLTGTAASYDVRYSTSTITAANWASATQATGEPTPAVAGTAQTFMVRGLSRQVTYYFAIRATDDAGNVSALSNVPSAITTDTMPPAAVTNLSASFVWLSWRSNGMVTLHGGGAR